MSMFICNPRIQAKAIKIGDRFFYGFGKKKRVQTAWALAGAKLFTNRKDLDSVMDALTAKGKKPQQVNIEVAA